MLGEAEMAELFGPPLPSKGLYALRAVRSGAVRRVFMARMAEVGRGISEEANQAVVLRERTLEIVQVMDEGTAMTTLCEFHSSVTIKDAVTVWPKVIGNIPLSVPVRGQTLVLLTESEILTFLAHQGDRAKLSRVGGIRLRGSSEQDRTLLGHQLCADPANGLVAVAAVQRKLTIYQCIYTIDVTSTDSEQPLRQVQALHLLSADVEGVIRSFTFVSTNEAAPALAVLVIRDDRESVWLFQLHGDSYVHVAILSTCATTPQSSAVYRMTSKLTGQTSSTPPAPSKATELASVPDCPNILVLLLEGRVVVADLSETLRAARMESKSLESVPLSVLQARRYGLATQPLLTVTNNDISYLIVPPHINFDLVSGSTKVNNPPALVTAITVASLKLRGTSELLSSEKVGLITTDHGDIFALRHSDKTISGGAALPGSQLCFGLQSIGRIGSCNSLAGLGNNMIILTSDASDGSVRKIVWDESGSARIEVKLEILNMAPITDFCFAPDMKTMYTCSGMGSWGSIRAIRNGTGTHVLSTSPPDYVGCHAVWSLCASLKDEYHSMVVLSYAEATSVLKIEPDSSLSEFSCESGFLLDGGTIATGLIGDHILAQVHATGVRLIFPNANEGYTSIEAWACNDEQNIVVGAVREGRIAVSISQGTQDCFLVTLVLSQGSLVVEGSAMLAAEVSSIDMWDHHEIPMLAIGTHAPSLEIRRIGEKLELIVARCITSFCGSSLGPQSNPVLAKLHDVELTPESVVVTEMAGELYTLVGLRNGCLVRLELSKSSLEPQRTSVRGIGQRPVKIVKIILRGSPAIMALSDSTMIMMESRRKVSMTAVASPPLDFVTRLNTHKIDNAVVALRNGILQVLSIKNPTEISTTKFILRETPKKIVHMVQDNVEYLVVCTSRLGRRDNGRSFCSDIRVLRASSGTLLGKYTLRSFESVFALCLWKGFIVLGTGYDVHAHRMARERCPRGRLLMLSVAGRLFEKSSLASRLSESGSIATPDHNVELQCEMMLPGAVFCTVSFGEILLASVGEILLAFQRDEAEDSLVEIARTSTRQCIVSVDVIEETGRILVADEKDSLGFLLLEETELRFHHEYWDHRKRLISDCYLVDKRRAAAVDKLGNFLTFEHGFDLVTQSQADHSLTLRHCFGLGSVSVRLRRGCLRHLGCPDEFSAAEEARWGLCAATLNGEVVCFLELSEEDYMLLSSVEHTMTLRSSLASEPKEGTRAECQWGHTTVVSGDIVSEFTQLDQSEQEAVVKRMILPMSSRESDVELIDRILSRLQAVSDRFFTLPAP